MTYKKREKQVAPSGWEAFNQKALYEAYEKRTSNIPYTQEVGALYHAVYLLKAIVRNSAVLCIPRSPADMQMHLARLEQVHLVKPAAKVAGTPDAYHCCGIVNSEPPMSCAVLS